MGKWGSDGVQPSRVTLIFISFILLIVPHGLAGCSSGTSGSNTVAAVPLPPNAPATAGQASDVPARQLVNGLPRSANPAETSPPVGDSASELLPYPKQSLFEVFRGSTEPQAAAVPHPPSTYAPAGQPYSPPPSQSASGVPAGSAPTRSSPTATPPQANADPSDYLPYPKQSVFDLFSNKQGAQ